MKNNFLFQGILLLLILVLSVHIGNAQQQPSVETKDIPQPVQGQYSGLVLSHQEIQWLAQNPELKVASPKAFPPFHFYSKDDKLSGMAADYLHLIFDMLHLKMDIQSNLPWPDVLKRAEEKTIDVISCIAKTEEREKFLLFSEPYMSFPLVIITKTTAPFIGGLDDLHGRKVAIVNKVSVYDWLKRDNIKIDPVYVQTPKEALMAVSVGKAEAGIENLAAASYLIQKNGLSNLKIAGPTSYGTYNLYIAFRNDFNELVPIFNKALASISPQQHLEIRNKWLSVRYEHGINVKDVVLWILVITGCSAAGFYAFYSRTRRLQKEIIARNKVEEALKSQKSTLDSIFRVAPTGIGLVVDRVIIQANDTLCKITGYTREELINQRSRILYPSDEDFEIVGREKYALIRDHGTGTVETHWQRKDGTIIDVLLSSTPVDLRDHSKGVTFTALDITERKRAEDELKSNYALLQIAGETAKFGGWSVDLKNNICTWSDAVADINDVPHGYAPPLQEAINFYAPEWQEKIKQIFSACVKEGIPYDEEMEIITQKGKRVWVRATGKAVKNEKDKIIKVHGSFQDITGKKHTEKALKESEEMMRSSQSVAHICSYSTNLNANETEKSSWVCSPEFYTIFGIDETYPHTIAGWVNFIHPDYREEVFDYHESVVKERKSFSLEYKIIRINDGAERWVHGTGKLEFDEKGNPFRMHGAIQDITERWRFAAEKEKLQSQLVQAQKMESVGQLAGGVAHDFNNMLAVILGHAELVMEELDQDQPIFKDLQQIQQAASRSTGITRQLLAFARKQIVSPKVIDLNETVAGMLKMLLRLIGENIDLAWFPGKRLWPIKIDPSQIDQILVNLCVNARDAIAGVGKITVETGNYTLDEEYCSAHAGFVSGQYVKIGVSDNGSGMDKETVSHIFEPFFTTKGVNEGTGLGLATIYGIIKQNNGFVNVYSEQGQGTTFSIYLPRYVGKTDTEDREFTAEPDIRGNETILLVEDEPTILNMTTTMLQRLGYTVLVAGTPSGAIRLAGEHSGEIHLVLTDVIMPEMDGRILTEKLMVNRPELKCLFMSGYTANVICDHGVLDAGVNFIQKPFAKRELATKIRQVLGDG